MSNIQALEVACKRSLANDANSVWTIISENTGADVVKTYSTGIIILGELQ